MSLCSLSFRSCGWGSWGLGGGANSRSTALRGPCFQPKKEYIPGVREDWLSVRSAAGEGEQTQHLLPARGPLFSPFPS